MIDILDSEVGVLPMVGDSYKKRLEWLGIVKVGDFLSYFPYRYEDLSVKSRVSEAKVGAVMTFAGEVVEINNIYTRNGKNIQKAIFRDDTGELIITWFNQPYLVKQFKIRTKINISGKVTRSGNNLTIVSPKFEPRLLRQIHTERLVPIYPETTGITSKWIRSRMDWLLNKLPPMGEPIEMMENDDLMTYDTAIRQIHFPDSLELAAQARYTLAFAELFSYQVMAQVMKINRKTLVTKFRLNETNNKDVVAEYVKRLEFKLTKDQLKAIDDILNDLTKPYPMNRLLQGDVGSGKTVVAGAIMYLMASKGIKSVMMAPTEILAKQHAVTLKQLLALLKIEVGEASKNKKDDLSKVMVAVGTQALLYRSLPTNVGLVIIDEQHRFGVAQRAKIIDLENAPHLLSMTATPIPRTVALTIYAQLDVSTIKENIKGRKTVKTWVVPAAKRANAYDWIKKQINDGGQVFVVCPLVKETAYGENKQIKAAMAEYKLLRDQVFTECRVGLIYGKMKNKEEVMKNFKQGQLDVLVATSVIEVGLDIARARVMVIEGAERFGLAQLHQLRGRVGRSDQQSYCLLFLTNNEDERAINRLKYLEKIYSGFLLAEIDLKLRGMGNLYGKEQSGFLDLKLASLSDSELIRATYQAAVTLVENDASLIRHPKLKQKVAELITKGGETNAVFN